MRDDVESAPMLGPEPPPAPPAPPSAQPRAATLTLLALATKHGQLGRPAPDGSRFSAQHEAAAVLHGWNAHEYHRGAVELTDEEYTAALKAAGTGTTHGPANRRPQK